MASQHPTWKHIIIIIISLTNINWITSFAFAQCTFVGIKRKEEMKRKWKLLQRRCHIQTESQNENEIILITRFLRPHVSYDIPSDSYSFNLRCYRLRKFSHAPNIMVKMRFANESMADAHTLLMSVKSCKCYNWKSGKLWSIITIYVVRVILAPIERAIQMKRVDA